MQRRRSTIVDNINNEIYVRISRGELNYLPPKPPKTVRIFISSTYSDVQEERDYLFSNVFPKLKQYCWNKYRLDFQTVDMRWGIIDESTRNNKELNASLKEIENCRRCSLGPYFIGLLSHKYGSRLLPTEIPNSEFESINNEAKELKINTNYNYNKLQTTDLLNHCYKCDKNDPSASYKLLEREAIIPEYEYKDESCEDTWKHIQRELLNVLRTVADTLYQARRMSSEQRARYFISTLDSEIQQGMLRHNDAVGKSIVFIRNIYGIEKYAEKDYKLASKYIDMNDTKIDEEARELLSDLKTKLARQLPEKTICKLKVKWTAGEGIRPNMDVYLQDFGEIFYEKIRELIDSNAALSIKSETPDTCLDEMVSQARTCKSYIEKFQGREDMLKQIYDYILCPDNKPFVLYGESGSGKSSILAGVVATLPKFVPDFDDYAVIFRFLGTTRISSHINTTLYAIIQQLDRLFYLTPNVPKSVSMRETNELKERLVQQVIKLKTRNPRQKIIFILDGLDELSGGDDLKWFPDTMPYDAKLIVSVSRLDVLEKLKTKVKYNPLNYLEVKSFDNTTATNMLQGWLTYANKTLAQNQMDVIKELFSRPQVSLTPLYIKLIYDIISTWTSYYVPDDKIKTCITTNDCIKYIFETLEKYHGKMLVSRCLYYMSTFGNGINENELEDILSIDDEVLTNIFEYYAPTLRRFPILFWSRIRYDINEYIVEREADDYPVITWFHKKFIEVVNQLYDQGQVKDEPIDMNVIDYFIETWNNRLKPFTYSENIQKRKGIKNDQSYRYTKPQQIENIDDNGVIYYNKRKLKELPTFILKISDSIKSLNLFKQHILFDYQFMHAKTMMRELEFLYDFVDIIWNVYSTQTNKNDKQRRYNEIDKNYWINDLIIVCFIIMQNMNVIHEYPDSLSLQITSRLVQFCKMDNEISFLIESYEKESCKYFPLIAPYNYLPFATQINTITQCKAAINRVVYCFTNPYLFILSEKELALMNHKNLNKLGKYNFADIEADFKLRIALKTMPTGDNTYISDMNGILVVFYDNTLDVMTFQSDTLYQQPFGAAIENVFILSTKHVLVCMEKCLQIIDIQYKTKVYESLFETDIDVVDCNINRQILFTPDYNQKDIFVIVSLKSGAIEIYKFRRDNASLALLFAIPSSDAEILSLVIDEVHFIEYELSVKPKNDKSELKFVILTSDNQLKIHYIERIGMKHDLRVNNVKLAPKVKTYIDGGARLLDFAYGIILFGSIGDTDTSTASSFYLYHIESCKITQIKQANSYAKILSEYTILVFDRESGKISIFQNSQYNADVLKTVQISSLELPNSVSDNSGLLITENEMIYPSYSSLHKINLDTLCDCSLLLNTDLMTTKYDNEVHFKMYDSEHLIVVTKLKECCIMDLSNQKIIEKIGNKYENIESIECCKNICILISQENPNRAQDEQENLIVDILIKETDVFEETYKIEGGEQCKVKFRTNNSNTNESKHFIVHMYDSRDDSVNLYEYEYQDSINVWYNKLNKFDLSPHGIAGQFSTTRLNVGLTDKSLYSVIISNDGDFYLIDCWRSKLLHQKSLSQLSYVTSDAILQIAEVPGTNDILVTSYNTYSKAQFGPALYIEIIKIHDEYTLFTWSIQGDSYRTHNSLFCIQFNKYLQIRFYDLNAAKEAKSFINPVAKISISDPMLTYGFSDDCKYFYTYEFERDLNLYRIKDSTKISTSPIHSPVFSFNLTDKYMTVVLNNGTLFSNMIIDIENDYIQNVKAIQALHNKNEAVVDGMTLLLLGDDIYNSRNPAIKRSIKDFNADLFTEEHADNKSQPSTPGNRSLVAQTVTVDTSESELRFKKYIEDKKKNIKTIDLLECSDTLGTRKSMQEELVIEDVETKTNYFCCGCANSCGIFSKIWSYLFH